MDDNVEIVVRLDIVQTDVAGDVRFRCEIVRWFRGVAREF